MKKNFIIIVLSVALAVSLYHQHSDHFIISKNTINSSSFPDLEQVKKDAEAAAVSMESSDAKQSLAIRRMIEKLPNTLPKEMIEKLQRYPKDAEKVRTLLTNNEKLMNELQQTLNK